MRADLVSLNIQRGRDHGILGYIHYNWLCCGGGGGSVPPNDWATKPAQISAARWEKLQHIYKLPYDIDLFTGGLAEDHVGGLLGCTFRCIIGKQFYCLENGDRYFYTHKVGTVVSSFTDVQLDIIKKRKFSDIICDNTDVNPIQKWVLNTPSATNPLKPCGPSTLNDCDILDLAWAPIP